MAKTDAITTVATRHTAVLLLCRKCGKKLKGGFGPDGDETLARVLKRGLREAGHRRVRVLETKCLGLCPKGAVTVLPGHAPDTLVAVPRGTDGAALALRLLPPP